MEPLRGVNGARADSKPRKWRRGERQIGAASCVFESRRGTGERLSDRSLLFLRRMGVDVALPAHDAIETIELRGAFGRSKRSCVIVQRWRVKLRGRNLSELASDAHDHGLTTYYGGIDGSLARFGVIPFANGSGAPLTVKHDARTLRRAKYNATHGAAEREARILESLQNAARWLTGDELPEDWKTQLASWVAIEAQYRAWIKIWQRDDVINRAEQLAEFASNADELLAYAASVQDGAPIEDAPLRNAKRPDRAANAYGIRTVDPITPMELTRLSARAWWDFWFPML